MDRTVTFWQNMPSHHLAPAQREMARLPGYRVRVIFVDEVSADRRRLGWDTPQLCPAESIILHRDKGRARRLAEKSHGINILGGFPRGILRDVFLSLPSGVGTLTALRLEAGDLCGPKGMIRPAYHTLLALAFRRYVNFVLAYGSRGVEYYTRCGFPSRMVYPFFYQNDENESVNSQSRLENSEVSPPPTKIVMAGSLIKRKGVDILLRALSQLPDLEWALDIIGEGPEEDRLMRLARRLGIVDRVAWRGVFASREMKYQLRQYHLCVVPSRDDGWGMLVNEAIASGVPVITTPAVGAKDIVTSSGAGIVASGTSPKALAASLEYFLGAPDRLASARDAAARAENVLSGRRAAYYLDAVIRRCLDGTGETPIVPWEAEQNLKGLN